MIELELPEGSPVEVPLDLRTVRGRPVPNAPARLAGRVVVGRPRSRRLAADAGADQELQQFIESEASKWDYHLIALSCTFVSDDEQRLADAWLRVNLSNPDNASDSPVAHSMEPVTGPPRHGPSRRRRPGRSTGYNACAWWSAPPA